MLSATSQSSDAEIESALAKPLSAVVIGASAGAVSALSELLPALPAETPWPVIVVVHLPANQPSLLPSLFARRCALRVLEPLDKQPIAPGIWFAPPDYHLLIEPPPPDATPSTKSLSMSFAMSVDDPVNHSRPSVDVLFESAADAWGAGVVAIVLTGANGDGALGAKAIREAGGLVIVQDPAEAEVSTMPQEAIDRARPQWIAPIARIASALKKAASTGAP